MADPNIFQQYLRPARSMLDYQTDYAKADALNNDNALQALTVQDKANVLRQKNAFRALVEGGADMNDPAQQARGVAIAPDVAPGAFKSLQDMRTSAAAAAKDNAQASNYSADAEKTRFATSTAKTNKALTDIASFDTPADAMASLQEHVKQGKISPEDAQLAAQTIPQTDDPAVFRDWKIKMIIHTLDAKDKIAALSPDVSMTSVGDQIVPTNRNPNAGPVGAIPGARPIPIGQSADNAASNATSRANVAATQVGENTRAAAGRAVQLQVAGIDPQNPTGPSAAALSPAAIENAAARYNLDGTLPPMAMGPRGAVGRTAIMNRAAELANGTDPTQLRVNQMDAKSAGSALTQLTKAKTMSASFEDTANQNANLALQLSKQNDRTGIPLLNAGLQAWRSGTGSPEATQFAAANETFVNEYAKIMSGGMGNGPVSDAARNKAHSLLTTAMTPDQYAGNVKLLQTEMQNRMKGFDDQENALRSRLTGKPTHSPVPATTAGGATVSSW